jgi:ABC-type transport system involved in cytochrome c biogenesis permease subunit
VTIGLTALAWAVQAAYLLNLGLSEGGLPVTTPFESLVVLSWIVAAVGLFLMVHSPRTAVGTFVLPIVIGLAALAGTAAPRQADWGAYGPGATAFWFWGVVHGVFLLAGAVSTCVAFAAGLMYLVQSNRLKHKRPSRQGFNLPSLEQSERINRGAVTLAFPLLTFGLLIGMILSAGLGGPAHSHNQIGGGAEGSALRWTDPKVVSALLTWVVFAALLHARFRPAMRGRGVVVMTIVAFAFLAFTWVGVEALRLPTRHGASQSQSQSQSPPESGTTPAAPGTAGRGS